MSTVVSKILKAIDEVGPEVAASHTQELRHRATQAGWHPDAIKALTVQHTADGKFKVDIADHALEHVTAHEYGDLDRAPRAVIGPFLTGLSHHATTQALAGRLRGVL